MPNAHILDREGGSMTLLELVFAGIFDTSTRARARARHGV